MAHDVFISHSTSDKAVSDAVCAALENAGIRCWIAPRDVQPGRSFAGEITRAIKEGKAMVLIFSAHSNNSEQVLREVQLAVNSHLHIVQFRIEDVLLNDDLAYFLSTPHWLDALNPPLEKHLDRLGTSIKSLLDAPAEESSKSAATPARQPQQPSPHARAVAEVPVKRSNKKAFVVTAAVAVCLAAAATWYFGIRAPEKASATAPLPTSSQAGKETVSTKSPLANVERAGIKATKEQPFVNTLGMKFVPVPATGLLFSIWETRVKDYEVFVEATKREWEKASFEQTEEHPAVNVSWEDATAFCEWLTEKERKAEKITASQRYRLPTDLEWSVAVGLEKESGATPESKDGKVKNIYPWGTKWPPPKGAGNYDRSLKVDDYEKTSPVGSFDANGNGIYDLGGNVWEWCEDWYNAERKYRVLRGASWGNYYPDYLLSSCRNAYASVNRPDRDGFRCVLVVESSR